jgi:hypothetical protein
MIVLLLVTLIGCFLNYRGLRSVAEPVVAALLAPVMSIFHLGAFSFVYDAVPRLGRYPASRTVFLILAGALATVAILATSTFFSWTGMAAPSSMRRHMITVIDDATATLSDLRDAHGREQELRDAVAQTAQSFGRNAQDERDHGLITSQKSPGPVSAACQSVADTFADAAAVLEKDDDTFKRDRAEVETVLSEMRALHAEASEHEERVPEINVRFAGLLLRMNGLLGEMHQNPIPSVLATVRKSDAIVLALPIRREANADAARTALLKLVKDAKQRIAETPTGGRDLIHVESFKTLDRAEASLKYLHVFPQYAIFAVVVDLCFPALGLLILAFFKPFPSRSGESAKELPFAAETEPQSVEDERNDVAEWRHEQLQVGARANNHQPRRKVGGRDVEALIEAARRSAAQAP